MKVVLKNLNSLSLKQMFWIIASVLVAVIPHIPRLPFWFNFFLIIVVAITWLSAKKTIKPISRWPIIVITISIFVAVLYFQGFALNREISVTVLTTMTVLKLLETHSKRDAWMVVMLCYFVILTRFFYSQDMLLMLYLISSVIIITHSLFVLQHTNNPKILVKTEIKQTLSLLMYGLPLAAMFFLFFPRLGSPIWGSPDLFGEGTTGISEEMSPGSISELFNDDSTAFRVTFFTTIPKKSQMYWRGPVMWDFDGMTWSKNHDLKPTMRHSDFDNQGQKIRYEVELEPTGQKYLFALDYMLKTSVDSTLYPDSQLMSDVDLNQLKHYKATSILKPYNQFEWLPQNRINRLTQLPKGYNPRTLALMQEWQKQTNNTEELIQKALEWFATDKFFYSYYPPLLSGNTVDQFLFETKKGFCEHYASAFTIMMRSLGIPARVVTGYQGGVKNGDYVLVKQSDAHAWSEVWISDKGWLRVDPTAAVSPLRVESGAQALMKEKSRNWYDSSWLRKSGERYDAIRHKWNKWVRNYNAKKQQALFEVFGFDSKDGKSIAMVIGSIIILSTLFVLLFLYISRPKRKLTHYDKIYIKFLKVFNKHGLKKAQHHGVLAFADDAIEKFPNAENEINSFVELYLKLRFSKQANKSYNLDKRLNNIIKKIKSDL